MVSGMYEARKLEEKDVEAVLQLCEGNPQYYQHCPPMVSAESIRADMQALPPGKEPEDKYYMGFFEGEKLVAVLDLILGYPDEETAFIGFFMVHKAWQGKGVGSRLVEIICNGLKQHFSYVRLGYVDGNGQSEHFWKKNGFHPTGAISKTEDYDIVIMLREL